MTNLDFVADGEQTALFLSVADQLKISRALDKKHSALIKKQRTQMQLTFVVTDPPNPSPPPSIPRKAYDLKTDIERLEQNF